MWSSFRTFLFTGGVLLAGTASAAEASGRLRELTTDRPDSTESPFTVNPGHQQLEMSFVSYGRDRLDGTRTEEWEGAPFNVRFGVTQNFEAGFFFTPYRRVTETPRGGPRETIDGVGDTTLRAKWNFVGNDGGPFGFGLMVDVKVPTAKRGLGNRKVEGAFTLPVAFELGGGWGGGAMTAMEIVHTDSGRHRAVWFNTLTFSRDLAENLGAFVEFTSTAGEGPHVATFNCGLTRQLDPNTQLDCGVNVGITRTAPDLLFFVGLSRRF